MQQEVFASSPPAPTDKDIVLAKLRPGQQVGMELHAAKGGLCKVEPWLVG